MSVAEIMDNNSAAHNNDNKKGMETVSSVKKIIDNVVLGVKTNYLYSYWNHSQ
jgi:hypothetical protein